ncbi:MAG: carboxypeptidase-like regulatory domain-containing protein [Candidatus Acidiferrales bacterium]
MKNSLRLSLILCWGAVAALAQTASPAGSITGTLFDSIGDPIDNNAVQAKNAESGAVFKATTARDGKYTLADLPPGTYEVSAAAPGLRGFDRKGVAVQASQVASLDIRLGDTTQLNTLGEDRTHQIADMKRHRPPSGPTPRTLDGKPDLSGVWWRPSTVDPGKPEFLPAALAITKQRAESNGKDSPQAHCLPSGPLRNGPLWEFVQGKDYLVYISDDESPGFHQVYLDGRPHPADPNPAWYGHSIGRWDGDTLVVDRVGFDPRVYLDQESHPHSDKLHIIERYHRPDLGHLEIEITVDDPGVLAKPWTQKRVADLANEEIFEFICTENNRDVDHLVGK